ncbi:MAG: nucleotide exchange factor GrpE [Alphaproteobacteria bacterium]|nr:MAG: nucleotide exchange factor GrpE [Alphaproteobacteria bacterium]
MSDAKENDKRPEDAPEEEVSPQAAEEAAPEQAANDLSAADEMQEALEAGSKTYEELLEENAALKDRLLRAMAEAENIRRRAAREKQEASKFGISNFAKDLVDVADNLRRAMTSIPEDAEEAQLEAVKNLLLGIRMTDKELHTVLERHSVTVVHPEGEKFNPNFHQAIAEIPSETHDKGHVVDVVQTGYLIGDRVLRPAMVTVSKGK